VTDLLVALAPWRDRIEAVLALHLDRFVDFDHTRPPTRLSLAMGHALLAGGKRLRPLVACAVARAVCGPGNRPDDDDAVWQQVMPAALALELVHTYSLIHDDLPALDDDDLRRGRPTVHRAFDEATAILAGDGLLTDAWCVLARAPRNAARQVEELALAAGSAGMVGGQADDLENEGRTTNDGASLSSLREVHRRKTGRLFGAACALGAWAVNDDADVARAARAFGAALGFAFQVQDDVLDVTGDVEKGGKTRGRDERHDKLTYVRALGLQGAMDLARSAGDEARHLADALVARMEHPREEHVNRLRQLALFAATRTY
jgi:geranylgeranyl diphosphate synthase type II